MSEQMQGVISIYEKIRIYWNLGKCIAEIPGVAKGIGDNAEKALRSLSKSITNICKDRCHTCWTTNVEITYETYAGKFMNTISTVVNCRECGTERIDKVFVEKGVDTH